MCLSACVSLIMLHIATKLRSWDFMSTPPPATSSNGCPTVAGWWSEHGGRTLAWPHTHKPFPRCVHSASSCGCNLAPPRPLMNTLSHGWQSPSQWHLENSRGNNFIIRAACPLSRLGAVQQSRGEHWINAVLLWRERDVWQWLVMDKISLKLLILTMYLVSL